MTILRKIKKKKPSVSKLNFVISETWFIGGFEQQNDE